MAIDTLDEAFKRAGRKVRRQLGRLSRVLDDLESFDAELAALCRAIRTEAARSSTGARALATALAEERSRYRLREALRQAAQDGITSIAVERRPDGSAILHIDGKTLKLKPRLAGLLDALLAQGTDNDGFVPHRQFAAHLRELSGLPTGDHKRAAHQRANLVWRLKIEFVKAGLSPAFIEGHRRRGVRLRMQQRK